MASIAGTLAAEERLGWLQQRLGEDGSVTLRAAAEALGVSEMTVRRDLEQLEQRGTARRVRGGATAVGPQTFAERHHTSPAAKNRIAAKLAELVPTSAAIAFDASSTVMRLASRLDRARDLTIVTNGLDTFAALRGRPGVTPLLTGGTLDERTGSLVGPIACRTAGQLKVSTFFASAAAIDPTSGALEATLEEADVKRSIASGAERVVLAADASKLAGRAVAVGLAWDQIDVVVTDLAPDDQRLDPYRELADLI